MIYPRITQVKIKNYKSIAGVQVDLEPLTILVGRNGSGKSNFMDALAFVSDALRTTLDQAIRTRGGFREICGRISDEPKRFGVSIQLQLPDKRPASYQILLKALRHDLLVVERERASIGIEPLNTMYDYKNGTLEEGTPTPRLTASFLPDRLYLPIASSFDDFRPLFDALLKMSFYNIQPTEMRQPQVHDSGDTLKASGANIAAIMKSLHDRDAQAWTRVIDYLGILAPGIVSVRHRTLGPFETTEFLQTFGSNRHDTSFYATNVSDGTLRGLGVLAALFQVNNDHLPPSLIGIEEPENSVHPGAANVLMAAISEASKTRQVIVTTHSPDLLDSPDVLMESIRVVENVGGETVIGITDNASKDAVRKQLYTPGELLRLQQISLNEKQIIRSADVDLFDFEVTS
jgi:predicted ATPase